MRWTRGGRSQDLEDARSQTGGRRLGRGGMSIGLGGIAILLLLSVVFKRDFLSLVNMSPGTSYDSTESTPDPERDAREEPMVQYLSFVLDDTQNTWRQIFAASGDQYRNAKLRLFRDMIDSACGTAGAATGRVNPESFTHGSSAQRVEWFSRGLKQGSVAACNAFE